MASWLAVLLAGAAVILVCFVVLMVLAAVGVLLRLSSGPVVVGARVAMVLMVVAAWVCLAAGLCGSIAGVLAVWR